MGDASLVGERTCPERAGRSVSGKPGPPRLHPDRIFTIAKLFVERYPNAKPLLERARDNMAEWMAWVEVCTNEHDAMVITMWYGDEREKSVAAVAELAEHLKKWDRAQGLRV